jgi:hypothetical protein
MYDKIEDNKINDEAKSIKSLVDDLSIKPYSEFGVDLDYIKEKHNDRINNSMIDNLRPKKPPHPAINKLYKNADKNFLNKIENIIKKTDVKKSKNVSFDDNSI